MSGTCGACTTPIPSQRARVSSVGKMPSLSFCQVDMYDRLPSRKSFLDSTQARNTSKQDDRTTLWGEEWNALGERSIEWRVSGIVQNEQLVSGKDKHWSNWRSLNRLRVQKGRCRGHDENVEALSYR